MSSKVGKRERERLTVPPRPPREMLLKRWPSVIFFFSSENSKRERESEEKREKRETGSLYHEGEACAVRTFVEWREIDG